MKVRAMITALTAAAIGLLSTIPAGASNPADLTSSYRLCPVRFVKAAYDGGPWCVVAIEPIGQSVALTAFHWSSENGQSRNLELTATWQMKPGVEIALIENFFHGSKPASTTTAMVDVAKGNFALGLLAPLDGNGDPQFGPRIRSGHWNGFLTVANGRQPLYGVSWCHNGNLEIATGRDAWFFRASKPYGKFRPELRTKFTKSETFVGFGIGFTP